MTHIRIRNFGLGDEWSQVEEDPTRQKLLKKYKVKINEALCGILKFYLKFPVIYANNGL